MNSRIRLALICTPFLIFLILGCNSETASTEKRTEDSSVKATTVSPTHVSFDESKSVTKISPDLYQQLADTLNLRVLKGTYKPGDSSIMHAHPDFALYVLEGSTVELTAEDGKKQNIEFKKDMAVVLPATTHSAKNIGNSTLRLVVVEVNRPRN